MDKETRNRIERATQAARALLEQDFADQLEGVFDIRLDGTLATEPGSHLDWAHRVRWRKLVAAVEHNRASGQRAPEAVATYLREAAFTTLNRFVALKMLEARDLVQECISRGEQSAGFKEFCGLAPGLVQLSDHGYRLYIESLFDELSTEVKVLFDRRDPHSVLWPRRTTFDRLMETLNAADLAGVWGENETIGWVYQFFNGQDERRKMREESQAPRNSRELAVRNQFFTPRYVVQFLTDNTLGRIWYEMRGTETVLADQCEYLVREPGESFAPRAKKDARDLRVLDPACGSGHFLLYAFDLLLLIYEEAWADRESPRSEATGRTLAEDYPSLDALRKTVPGLILAYNLHGVDIDPRCAQIAQLALWMRAQKAYRDFAIGRAERPQIRRSNIVVAEPLVADEQIVQEFVAKLGDAELGRVFMSLVESLSLAGDLGLLLRVEQLVARPAERGQTGDLFAPPEERIRAALARFVREEANATSTRRRLFADDTAHGLGLFSIAEKAFDVVLMNPPFGAPTETGSKTLSSNYGAYSGDILTAFVSRAHELCPHGLVGGIFSRAPFFLPTAAKWRREAIHGDRPVGLICDLGAKVLDAALVEAMAVVLGYPAESAITAVRLVRTPVDDKATELRKAIAACANGRHLQTLFFPLREDLKKIEGAPLIYSASKELAALRKSGKRLGTDVAFVEQGLSTKDDFRFLRLWWEVSPGSLGDWVWLAKGGEYRPFYSDVRLVVRAKRSFRELHADLVRKYPYLNGNTDWVLHPESHYLEGGVTYPERTTSSFGPRLLPRGSYFSHVGLGIVPRGARTDSAALCGWLMSRPVQLQVELQVGSADAVESGSAARHYSIAAVGSVMLPAEADLDESSESVVAIALAAQSDCVSEETSPLFVGLVAPTAKCDLHQYAQTWLEARENMLVKALSGWESFERSVESVFGIPPELLDDEIGQRAVSYPTKEVAPAELTELFSLSTDELVDRATAVRGHHRAYSKKSYLIDRQLELVCACLEAHPRSVIESRQAIGWMPPALANELAQMVVSYIVGHAFGRFGAATVQDSERLSTSDALLRPHSLSSPAMLGHRAGAILVDDDGHPDDLYSRLYAAFEDHSGFTPAAWPQLWEQLCGDTTRGRAWLARELFPVHLARYSDFRRKAPIYWQLATPSASYSVWLYIHAFSKDTLFRVQNDYVAPKLAHEERRLEALTAEQRDGATATERKALAEQQALVEELRAFLSEVKRVAPLWNPDLDDGVIINFAPLWRLVPQHKAWQKELKSTWDALCEGKYDWAHLAMHLWPERVVPKCAKDRSLAIAHDLENVFWEEDDDGKWKPVKVPHAEIDQLIAERTSTAVKAALQSLLDAPPPTTGRGGGRRASGRGSTRRTQSTTGRQSSRASAAPDPAVMDFIKQAIEATGGDASKADVLAATGLSDSHWNSAIAALLAEGSVVKTGTARGTRYRLKAGD